LQELFRSKYFCQSEDQRNFELAEAFPDRAAMRSASWRGGARLSSSLRFSSGARQHLSQ
jgi:hypothetical protein